MARFCEKCGSPISGEAVFCPSCGHKIKRSEELMAQDGKAAIGVAERKYVPSKEEFGKIGITKTAYASRIDSSDDKEVNDLLFTIYEKMISPVKEIESLEAKMSLNNHQIKKNEILPVTKFEWHPIRVSIISVVFFVLLAGFTTHSVWEKNLILRWLDREIHTDSELIGWTIAFGRMIIVGLVAYLAVKIPMYLFEKSANKKQIKEQMEENEVLRTQNNEMLKREEEICKEIAPLICYCPPAYRTSDALMYFSQSYKNTRVDNVKEAVLAYDTVERHMEVCSILSTIHYQQQITNMLLESIDAQLRNL